MQYCLNINPTIDKAMEFADFRLGEMNRPQKIRVQAGGKAVNAALVLKALGGDPKVIGVVFHGDGDAIKNALEAQSIFYDFHECEGQSRLNLKIADVSTGKITEINEEGEEIDAELLRRIADELVSSAFQGDTAVLSGRLPHNAPDTYYADLVTRLQKKQVRTVVDTSGAALRAAADAGPFLLKPNLAELEELTGKPLPRLGDVIEAARELIGRCNIRIIVVSFGAYGALAVSREETAYAAGIDVPAVSAVGAGDSLVAGLIIREDASLVEMLKSGMAAAAGSVSLEATDLCTPQLYRSFLEKVIIDEDPDPLMEIR